MKIIEFVKSLNHFDRNFYLFKHLRVLKNNYK